MSFKPMLAVNAVIPKIQYPVYASPKLDGIRCSVVGGKALSRTLKPIPNKAIYGYLSHDDFNGLDGELIVGSPTAKDVYNKTVSQVMAHDKGLDNVFYNVFDFHNRDGGFAERYDELTQVVTEGFGDIHLKILEQKFLTNEDDLMAYEAAKVEEGYEGVIIRSPNALYKFGRSTVNEGALIKLKRFLDSEAVIIGFEEEMFNGNAAETNELGRTKRSTAAAGLSGKGTLGAFKVRDLETGVEFSIGTGLTAAERQHFWNRQDEHFGKFVKYKYFPVGVKVAPRHPVYLGLRDARDM